MHRSTTTKRLKAKARPIFERLSEDELQEFKLRHAAFLAASHQLLMVQESYQAWVKKTLGAHGVEGLRSIDLQTGAIKPGEVNG